MELHKINLNYNHYKLAQQILLLPIAPQTPLNHNRTFQSKLLPTMTT